MPAAVKWLSCESRCGCFGPCGETTLINLWKKLILEQRDAVETEPIGRLRALQCAWSSAEERPWPYGVARRCARTEWRIVWQRTSRRCARAPSCAAVVPSPGSALWSWRRSCDARPSRTCRTRCYTALLVQANQAGLIVLVDGASPVVPFQKAGSLSREDAPDGGGRRSAVYHRVLAPAAAGADRWQEVVLETRSSSDVRNEVDGRAFHIMRGRFHAAPLELHPCPPAERAVPHLVDHPDAVRRCHRSAWRVRLAGNDPAGHRRHGDRPRRGADRHVAADRRRLARAHPVRPQQLLPPVGPRERHVCGGRAADLRMAGCRDRQQASPGACLDAAGRRPLPDPDAGAGLRPAVAGCLARTRAGACAGPIRCGRSGGPVPDAARCGGRAAAPGGAQLAARPDRADL